MRSPSEIIASSIGNGLASSRHSCAPSMSLVGNLAGPDAAAIRRVLKNSLIDSTSGCSRSRRDSRVEPHRPVPTTKVSCTVIPDLGHPVTDVYRTAVAYAP